jgi:hypothetical protein
LSLWLFADWEKIRNRNESKSIQNLLFSTFPQPFQNSLLSFCLPRPLLLRDEFLVIDRLSSISIADPKHYSQIDRLVTTTRIRKSSSIPRLDALSRTANNCIKALPCCTATCSAYQRLVGWYVRSWESIIRGITHMNGLPQGNVFLMSDKKCALLSRRMKKFS